MIMTSRFTGTNSIEIFMLNALSRSIEKLNSRAQLRVYPDSDGICANPNYLADKFNSNSPILNKIHQSSLWIESYCSNFAPKNLISQAQNLVDLFERVNGKVEISIRSILNNPRTGQTGTPQGCSKFNQIGILAAQC